MRKFLTLFAGLCLVVILLGMVVAYHRVNWSSLFPVRHVEVEGDYQFVTQEMIARAAMPYVTDGFFKVHVFPLEQEISTLPGVEQTEVRLIWPGTVQVRVTEQSSVARTETGWVVTDQAKIFKPIHPEAADKLPLFVGDDAMRSEMVLVLPRFQKILARVGLVLAVLTQDAVEGFVITTENDIKIFLGKQDFVERLELFARAYPVMLSENKNKNKRLLYANLNYNNGFAVRWGAVSKASKRHAESA